jgi:hypothetical protein
MKKALVLMMLVSSLCWGQKPLVMAWNLPNQGNADYNDFQKYVVPNIDGVVVVMSWNKIETSQGVYSFTSFDNSLQTYVNAKKKIALVVWAVTSGSPNTSTPSYVLKQVPSVSCPAYSNYPVVFNSFFQTRLQAFHAALVKHYNTVSWKNQLAYIRLGIGGGGGAVIPCPGQLYPYSNPKNASGLQNTWTVYVDAMYAAMKNDKASFPIEISMYGGNGPLVPITYPDTEAASGFNNGLGIGAESLSNSDITLSHSNNSCSNDWCNIFIRYPKAVVLGLQTIGASDPTGKGLTGSLVPLIPFAATFHPTTLELYRTDLEIAYDPNNVNYKKYGAAYRTAIAAR